LAPLNENYKRKFFQVPLRSAAATSTVILGFLNFLGADDRIRWVSQYATEPCWQKAIKCNATLSTNTTIKEQQLDDVEGVFMDCTGDCSNVHKRTNGVNVPTTHDSSPLRIAEYIKFLAAFFNLDPKGNELHSEVVEGYRNAAVDKNENPTVAWVSFTTYPDDAFELSQAAFKLAMVTHVAGQNVNATKVMAAVPGMIKTDAKYRVPLTAYGGDKAKAGEALMKALADVDVVIDETWAAVPADYTFESFLATFGILPENDAVFVQNKMVLRYDGTISENNGLDWFESRIARPDWAAQGLARCVHKDNNMISKYFRNIAQGEKPEVMKASQCKKDLPVCGEGSPATIPLLGDGKAPTSSNLMPWIIGGTLVLLALAGGGLYLLFSRKQGQPETELPLQTSS